MFIQLYEYVKNEYEKKLSNPLDSSAHFETMFEATIDIFEEGNNISFKKILNNIYMYQG